MRVLTFLIPFFVCSILSITALSQTTFTGVISSDWQTEGNWDNGLPGPGNDATIPTGTNVIIPDGVDIDYTLYNAGNIEINEVAIVVTGTIENFGNISAYGTAIIEIQPDGSIINLSGVISNYATIYNDGFILNDGFIDNEGYFLVLPSGMIINEATGSIDNSGEVFNDGSVENVGLINQCGFWNGSDPIGNPLEIAACQNEIDCTLYECDCADGMDNDGDGQIDCDDSDCASNPSCSGGTGGTTFTGVISSDWQTEGNWDNGLPGPGNDATIPTGSNVIISDGLDIDYTLYNQGDIEINEASIVVTGTIENGGSLSAYGTAIIEIQPDGSIINLSGVISNYATIYNDGFILNDGFIDNEGYFLVLPSGMIINEATGSIDNSGEVFNDGSVENVGLINQCGLWNGSDPIGNPLEIAACQNEIDCTLYECDCADGIDNDGDGQIDCDDSDCVSTPECVDCITYECDCADGIDNDSDGQIDCDDSDCVSAPECVDCITYECDCADGIDNDSDGQIDCNDSDCVSNPSCSVGIGGTTFTGVISSDWHTEGNWDNGLPGPGNDATIPNGSNVIISDGLDIDYTFYNEGDIEINEAFIVVTGTIENFGNISAYGTAIIEIQQGGGIINLSGVISNYASIENFGFIYNDGFIDNEGYFLIHDLGTIVNEATGSIDNSGEIFNNGAVDNVGLINQCGLWNGSDPFGNPYTNENCDPNLGCTDVTACNFNAQATIDNGFCTYPGCNNAAACNYNFSAGCDDGSCVLPDGCTDSTACNYDPAATCDDGSCAYPGCTDAAACNYDFSAGCDDGSCVFTDGCTDLTACNYDPAATCDDGSCAYPGCADAAACNYDSASTCDDGLCTYPGCVDATACNFDPTAGCDDGSCYYCSCAGPSLVSFNYQFDYYVAEASANLYDEAGNLVANLMYVEDGSLIVADGEFPDQLQFDVNGSEPELEGYYLFGQSISLSEGTYTLELLDSYGDGWIWENVYGGVFVDSPEGFLLDLFWDDSNAGDVLTGTFNVEGGAINSACGCTDPMACNFDPNALYDDDSCQLLYGCTDSTACNYDSAATCDDGTCTYPGCDDATACNYDSTVICDDGSCTYSGCNNASACNFDPDAGCDDGSCIFPDGCSNISACNYNASAICDDGSCEFLTCRGCTGQMACNYDPNASIDDGSCDYVSCAGCTYALAPEYDPTATLDDGSCASTTPNDCPSDLNGDLTINAADLLLFLGGFGGTCE